MTNDTNPYYRTPDEIKRLKEEVSKGLEKRTLSEKDRLDRLQKLVKAQADAHPCEDCQRFGVESTSPVTEMPDPINPNLKRYFCEFHRRHPGEREEAEPVPEGVDWGSSFGRALVEEDMKNRLFDRIRMSGKVPVKIVDLFKEEGMVPSAGIALLTDLKNEGWIEEIGYGIVRLVPGKIPEAPIVAPPAAEEATADPLKILLMQLIGETARKADLEERMADSLESIEHSLTSLARAVPMICDAIRSKAAKVSMPKPRPIAKKKKKATERPVRHPKRELMKAARTVVKQFKPRADPMKAEAKALKEALSPAPPVGSEQNTFVHKYGEPGSGMSLPAMSFPTNSVQGNEELDRISKALLAVKFPDPGVILAEQAAAKARYDRLKADYLAKMGAIKEPEDPARVTLTPSSGSEVPPVPEAEKVMPPAPSPSQAPEPTKMDVHAKADKANERAKEVRAEKEKSPAEIEFERLEARVKEQDEKRMRLHKHLPQKEGA